MDIKKNEELSQALILKIPERWEIKKLEDISLDFVSGGTPSTANSKYWSGEIAWMTSAHIRGREVATGQRYITREGLTNSATKIVPRNNLLVATRVGIGKVAINRIDIAISQDLTGVLIDRDKTSPEFIYWILIKHENKLKSLAQGSTIKGILREELGKLEFFLPPLIEQKKIAEILSTVDQAIENVEGAIEKTQRMKKGLMQVLLTKGIGHKEFKETEIGKIPKNWNLSKLFDLADIKGGKRLPKGHTLVDSKTLYPYVRVVDFKNMSVDVGNLKYLFPETQKLIKKYTISSNDVYISIAGTVGISGLLPAELNGANLTENAAKLCNLRNIRKDFLAFILNSPLGQRQISTYIGKAQQPKLALFRIEKIKIPVPPVQEQQKIAEILGTVDKRLEAIRNRKEKLEKIKKGLMEDLLTGKVRVTQLIEKEA